MSDNKIDLVYLWVDGDDENWRAEKDKWLQIIKGEREPYRDATVAARWRDNDELKYSLRSAEKFAPWINHIYIVTGFGQVPKWLNTKNPKLTMISHEQIMPADALPTFNSNAIEMCIMNIPGLSEHFLLANDDMFFGRPLTPDFFYDKRGRTIIWHTNHHGIYRDINKWIQTLNGYMKTLAHSAMLIRDIFGKSYFSPKPAHNIDPYIKSSMLEVKNHPIIAPKIDETIRNKFRTTTELQRWIFNLYDLANGRCVLRKSRYYKSPRRFIYNCVHCAEFYRSPAYAEDAKKAKLAKFCPPLFCINDRDKLKDYERKNNREFLESTFPEKSSFEK